MIYENFAGLVLLIGLTLVGYLLGKHSTTQRMAAEQRLADDLQQLNERIDVSLELRERDLEQAVRTLDDHIRVIDARFEESVREQETLFRHTHERISQLEISGLEPQW